MGLELLQRKQCVTWRDIELRRRRRFVGFSKYAIEGKFRKRLQYDSIEIHERSWGLNNYKQCLYKAQLVTELNVTYLLNGPACMTSKAES